MSEDFRSCMEYDAEDWVSAEEFMQAGKYWMALFGLTLTDILKGQGNDSH